MIQQDGQVNVGTSVTSDTRLLLLGSKDCITSAIFCYGEAPDKVSKAARNDVPIRQVDAPLLIPHGLEQFLKTFRQS